MGFDSDFHMAYLYYLGSEMGTATHMGTMGLLGLRFFTLMQGNLINKRWGYHGIPSGYVWFIIVDLSIGKWGFHGIYS